MAGGGEGGVERGRWVGAGEEPRGWGKTEGAARPEQMPRLGAESVCERRGPGSWSPLPPHTPRSAPFSDAKAPAASPREARTGLTALGRAAFELAGSDPQCLLADICLQGENRDPLGSMRGHI